MKAAPNYVGLDPKTVAKSGPALVKMAHALEGMSHQAKTAQYNVRGNPAAAGVAQITGCMIDQLHRLADPLVRRAQVVGWPVSYNLAFVLENSGLEPFPLDLDDPGEIVQTLADVWGAVCEIAREQIALMRDAGDMVSAHIAEHQLMELECATSVLQDVLARDPDEALEAIGTEARRPAG